MAKTRIVLDFSFSVDKLKDSISKADLTGKEALEVYYGFHALKAWRSEFEETNGSFQSMLHHSNPDDPPDLVFQFSDRELCAEEPPDDNGPCQGSYRSAALRTGLLSLSPSGTSPQRTILKPLS